MSIVPALSTTMADALVILGSAGVVIPLFARFRITPVIGFILVGFVVGPGGLGRLAPAHPWLANVTISGGQAHHFFAQIGIILLLFSGGLELSFDRLRTMRRQVFGLGAPEMMANAALLTAATLWLGLPISGALAVGAALAMSSTALVLRITQMHTPVGRAALAMLLFEDIALVPLIFLLGALAPLAAGAVASAGVHMVLGIAVLLALVLAGRMLLPPLFAQAARTRSPELFLAASLVVVIIASLATAASGLSPILGALVAGLMIAGTEYHGEVESMTAPFKGLGLGIFLITVGMGLGARDLWQHPLLLLGATALVLTIKAVVTALLLRTMGARPGTATEAGILLAAPSETTLIVLAAAQAAKLISPSDAQFWQAVTAIGLMVTPALADAGRRLARRVEAALPAVGEPVTPDGPEGTGSDERAIVIGFGRVGRMVADMLRRHNQPFLAVDADADLARAAREAGYPVTFGDAGRGNLLEQLGVARASAVILTMDTPAPAARLVRRLRTAHPQLTIIARARDAAHAAQLYAAGATHAVPETLEASLQLAEAVLAEMGVPMGFVIASIHEKRDELREEIMRDGGLTEKPQLKSSGLRERT